MTCAWSDELTYGYFERLLEGTRELFELRRLRDGAGTDADPPRAIVRHDVDVCLWRAVALAECEARWGVASTYLVQVDSPLYRLDDDQGRAALRRLAELGHEVGLHVDVGSTTVDGDVTAAIEPRVRAARERLMALTGAPVESVSFHRPAPWLLRGPNRICGMVNAYGRELMATYLSDSEGRWRHGEPLPHVRAAKSRVVQLLIHPIWWAERHLSPGDRLQEFFEASIKRMTPAEVETFDVELLRAVEPARRSGLG
jgi:hypothetical protein